MIIYKFICPIFRLDKTSLYQGLEKLSEKKINRYSISSNTNIKIKCDWWRNTIDEKLYKEVIIKICVNRLNFISSAHPIGFKCFAFRS